MTNKNGGANDVKFDGSVPDASTDVDNAGSITPTIFNYTANVIQVGNNAPTAGKYALICDVRSILSLIFIVFERTV